MNYEHIVEEIIYFKHAALSVFPSIESTSFLDAELNMIHDFKLQESYPHVEITIKVFLSETIIIITLATCERIVSENLN